MAFSLLWSFGLVISILIFAVAIGFCLGCAGTGGKPLAIVSVGSVICTFILVYGINMFKTQLNSAMGSYNYLLLFLIALVLMFIGFSINKQNEDKGNLMKIISLSYLCFILTVVMCVGSKESLFGLDSFQISILAAVLFGLIMVMAFFASGKLDFINISYGSLGSMYFILGIYCLVVCLFLPNIIGLNMDDMRPINVGSLESIAGTVVLLIVVTALGLVYNKKKTLLK